MLFIVLPNPPENFLLFLSNSLEKFDKKAESSVNILLGKQVVLETIFGYISC